MLCVPGKSRIGYVANRCDNHGGGHMASHDLIDESQPFIEDVKLARQIVETIGSLQALDDHNVGFLTLQENLQTTH